MNGGIGGIFTSTVGLVINNITGEIDLAASVPGTYIVTNTIEASGGCDEVSATASITILESPTASINYEGNPFCASSDPISVTLIGTPGGTYTSDPAGLTINSSTGEITPSTSLEGTYIVTYTVEAINDCGSVT